MIAMRPLSQQMLEWARIGASIRLRELRAEAQEIHSLFPELKRHARSERMKATWAKRKAGQRKDSASL